MNAKKIQVKFGLATYIFFQSIESALNYCEIASYEACIAETESGEFYLPYLKEDVLSPEQKIAALKNLEGLFLINCWERDGKQYVSFRRPAVGERKLKAVKKKIERPQVLINLELIYDTFLLTHKQNKDVLWGAQWTRNRAGLKNIYASLRAMSISDKGLYSDEKVCAIFEQMLRRFDDWPKFNKKFELYRISDGINDIVNHLIKGKNGNDAKPSAEQRINEAANKRGNNEYRKPN